MTRKRSKIRSKAQSDGSQKSEDEIQYCICRSSDGTRFMIACDNCEEWYHGDCINVTPKQANNIKHFYCHLCIGRNPSLEIEYKTIKENRPRLPNLRQQIKKINFSSDDENDADLSSSSTPDKSFPSGKSKRTTRKRSRPSLSESVKSLPKKRRGRPKEKHDDYDDEATEDEIETSGIAPSINDCTPISISGHPDDADLYNKKSFRSQISSNNNIFRSNYVPRTPSSIDGVIVKGCGICDGCKLTKNCGKCDVCLKCSSNITSKSMVCRKRVCSRNKLDSHSQHQRHQYNKDYSAVLDDFEDILEEGNYPRNPAMRSRNEVAITEIRQRLRNSEMSSNDSNTVGSKMRRGDHLPGGGNSTTNRRILTNQGMPYKYYASENVDTNGTSFRYQNTPHNRLSRNQTVVMPPLSRRSRSQSDAAPISDNTSPLSVPQSSQNYQYEESDEDVMIPNDLMSNNSQRRSIATESEVERTFNQIPLRSGRPIVHSDTKRYQYGLSYPDHLYCKHHRFFNWHSTGGTGESISSDSMTVRSEPLRSSDKEMEMSQSTMRSPSLEQPLSPGNYVVLDRNSKPSQICTSSSVRPKSHLKTVGSLNSADRQKVTESYVTLYTDGNQAYPIVDLNQHLSSDISLKSTKPTKESVSHSSVFLKKPAAVSAQSQEFYTINDDDALEINWPKETVNV